MPLLGFAKVAPASAANGSALTELDVGSIKSGLGSIRFGPASTQSGPMSTTPAGVGVDEAPETAQLCMALRTLLGKHPFTKGCHTCRL